MAESKICGTVVDGKPVQVKVIFDFQRAADKLARKAQGQKNGKASDCHGCVRIEVVPIKKSAEAATTEKFEVVKSIEVRGGRVTLWQDGDQWSVNIYSGLPSKAYGKFGQWKSGRVFETEEFARTYFSDCIKSAAFDAAAAR